MSALTRPIINIHVRLFRFPRYVIPAQCSVEPAQVSDLSDTQLPGLGPATHQHSGDARISLYRYLARVCSSPLSSLCCPRISHLTRLRLRWILEYSRSVWAGHGPDAERWVTNGKQRENENMWGVQRLSVIILYPSLLTACWYNSFISVSIKLHPWQNILYSHLI